VSRLAREALLTKKALVIIPAMNSVGGWIKLGPGGPEGYGKRYDTMTPLIESALSAPDSFTRLGGALALLESNQLDRLRELLAADGDFLLSRPKPAKAVLEKADTIAGEVNKENESIRLAVAVEAARDRLIEATGQLRIQSLKKVLEAIANDSEGDLIGHPIRSARRALSMMGSTVGSNEPGDFERRASEPTPEPAVKIQGTHAKTIGIPVAVPSSEERRLFAEAVKAFDKRTAPDLFLHHCEHVVDANHSLVM
jgi:hypothetical protein